MPVKLMVLMNTFLFAIPISAQAQPKTMRVRLLLLLWFLTSRLCAQAPDTISTKTVATGVKLTSISFPSLPLKVSVLEADLTNPLLNVETAKAAKDGNEILFAKEKTSSIALRKTNDSILVVGAVNGDFFDIQNGAPINLQVENGEVVKKSGNVPAKSVFGMTKEKRPFVERVSLKGRLFASRDSGLKIDNLNEASASGEAIVFNKYYGERTGTVVYGTVLWLRRISEAIVHDTVLAIVDSLTDLSGNARIPLDGYVLIARGKARGFVLRKIAVHDTLKILFELIPRVGKVTQAIGGWPRIVRGGKNTFRSEAEAEEAIPGNTDRRHPRTAVGISKDGKKLYFVVVDGRQASSIGITLDDLANLMIRLGAHNAINLDGGGSTTMVVNGKVVNSPSDPTGERPVSNAIIVTMKRNR